MEVREIDNFLKQYGLPHADDDQGAASSDFLDFVEAVRVDFEF